jgi:hypothetical protein
MAPYKHQPPKDYRQEIRLLRLLPSQSGDKLEAEIFHVPFSSRDNPNYEALPYVWGTTNDPSKISVRDSLTQTKLQYTKEI